jgi:hypothetical protein
MSEMVVCIFSGCERFNASDARDVSSGLDDRWAVRCPSQGQVRLTIYGQVCVSGAGIRLSLIRVPERSPRIHNRFSDRCFFLF